MFGVVTVVCSQCMMSNVSMRTVIYLGRFSKICACSVCLEVEWKLESLIGASPRYVTDTCTYYRLRVAVGSLFPKAPEPAALYAGTAYAQQFVPVKCTLSRCQNVMLMPSYAKPVADCMKNIFLLSFVLYIACLFECLNKQHLGIIQLWCK
ncbi:hypothetical protein IG631_06108 [Alternaria alternata]|nr:hypothetical protein IG631_06108 [Alternaria alternata]